MLCLVLVSVFILGLIVPNLAKNDKLDVNTSDIIAIVNVDDGVKSGDNSVNYASSFATDANSIISTTLIDAKEGIESGKYGAYIIIPSNFSEIITGISKKEDKLVLKVVYANDLDTSTQINIYEHMQLFKDELQLKTSSLYVEQILNDIIRFDREKEELIYKNHQLSKILDGFSNNDITVDFKNELNAPNLDNQVTLIKIDVDDVIGKVIYNCNDKIKFLKSQQIDLSKSISKRLEELIKDASAVNEEYISSRLGIIDEVNSTGAVLLEELTKESNQFSDRYKEYNEALHKRLEEIFNDFGDQLNEYIKNIINEERNNLCESINLEFESNLLIAFEITDEFQGSEEEIKQIVLDAYNGDMSEFIELLHKGYLRTNVFSPSECSSSKFDDSDSSNFDFDVILLDFKSEVLDLFSDVPVFKIDAVKDYLELSFNKLELFVSSKVIDLSILKIDNLTELLDSENWIKFDNFENDLVVILEDIYEIEKYIEDSIQQINIVYESQHENNMNKLESYETEILNNSQEYVRSLIDSNQIKNSAFLNDIKNIVVDNNQLLDNTKNQLLSQKANIKETTRHILDPISIDTSLVKSKIEHSDIFDPLLFVVILSVFIIMFSVYIITTRKRK